MNRVKLGGNIRNKNKNVSVNTTITNVIKNTELPKHAILVHIRRVKLKEHGSKVDTVR